MEMTIQQEEVATNMDIQDILKRNSESFLRDLIRMV